MDKSNAFDPEKTIDATWCVDSETGERYLLDNKTGQVIATGDQVNGKVSS